MTSIAMKEEHVERRAASARARALDAWEALLGPELVVTDEDALRIRTANVTAFRRRIHAVIAPRTTDEVQAAVRIARRYRVPLYPTSTGKNWGLGSSLPVESGAVLVDLRRMDAIRELSETSLFATVEPGVTQAALYAQILARGLPLVMNVTGSSAQSSIIGNALERGIGYSGLRADETWNLEVVLGTGELLRTGFGHSPDSVLGPLYRHGIGPSLDGLFFQSNFGIVTAATVALRRTPPAHAAAVVSIASETDLPRLIDAVAAVRRSGFVDGVIHIGDRARSTTTLAPLVARALVRDGLPAAAARRAALEIVGAQGFGAWSALIGISGSSATIRAALREIRAKTQGFARVRVIDERRLAWARTLCGWLRAIPAARRQSALLEALAPLYGLTRGVPTDAAVASVAYAAGEESAALDPDQSDAGMLYCLPLMPLAGSAARQALDILRTHGETFGIELSVTFNAIDARVLEAVITIPFCRIDPASAARAHRCGDALRTSFLRSGFTPYRVDIAAMNDVVDEKDLFWQKALALKTIFDPDQIIACGRYSLA